MIGLSLLSDTYTCSEYQVVLLVKELTISYKIKTVPTIWLRNVILSINTKK